MPIGDGTNEGGGARMRTGVENVPGRTHLVPAESGARGGRGSLGHVRWCARWRRGGGGSGGIVEGGGASGAVYKGWSGCGKERRGGREVARECRRRRGRSPAGRFAAHCQGQQWASSGRVFQSAGIPALGIARAPFSPTMFQRACSQMQPSPASTASTASPDGPTSRRLGCAVPDPGPA